MHNQRHTNFCIYTLLLGSALSACNEPVQVGQAPANKPAGAQKQAAPSAQAATPEEAAAAEAGAEIATPTSEVRDEDFVENDVHRDPFRDFSLMFRAQPTVRPQRTVLMPMTSIDEMKLIAIVTRVPAPRAMLVDSTGIGYVVERGDYIGRPEVVQAGGAEGMPITLNWRVDRIRCGAGEVSPSCEVILTREDPTAPNRPPLTRVIPLYEPDKSVQTG